jgi:hypothetical protein
MAIQVNPPPLLTIPRKFLEDREVRAFIEQQNTIIFQLWNRTGANVDFVSEGAEGVAENAAAIIVNSTNIATNADAINDNTDLINDNTDLINETPVYSGFMAQIQFLQRQFDGLPEFTIDTSGFTTDSTFITTDKVIA